MKKKDLKLRRKGYLPTHWLRFIKGVLYQLWGSDYEGNEDKWIKVEGQ